MRCSSCGLPLSPSRTHCPRCGTAIAKGTDGQSSNFNIPTARGFTDSGMQAGMQPSQQQWGQPTPPWNAQGAPPMTPPQQADQNGGQVPFPMMNAPMPFPAPNTPMPYPPQTPQPQEQWNQAQSFAPPPANISYQTAPWPQGQPGPFQDAPRPFPQPPQTRLRPNTPKRSPKTGFTVAGLFIFTGALILVLVFFLAQGLAPSPQAPVTAQKQPAATSNTSPTATQAASPNATAAASPTAANPGQQYIDTPQMASAVNKGTAQPTQLATTFNVKQTVFVTFTLHPGTTGGAVCLLWYVNNQQFSRFAFAVDPLATPEPAYSFANAKAAGPAYVELYWASTTACSDKMLAQRVDFTVQ